MPSHINPSGQSSSSDIILFVVLLHKCPTGQSSSILEALKGQNLPEDQSFQLVESAADCVVPGPQI